MLTSTQGIMPYFDIAWAWVHGYGTGDSWDGFFYNNAHASGTQLYPKGFAKYFDTYSVDGIVNYSFHYIWDLIQHFALPLTFMVPVDVWMALLDGKSMEGIWKIFLFYQPFVWLSAGIPSVVAKAFNVEMEDGWGMMDN